MTTNKNTYTCSMCLVVYEKGWSDEEAKKEFEEEFPNEKIEEGCVVCDDCYKLVMGKTNVQ